jgi:hypothetical protein
MQTPNMGGAFLAERARPAPEYCLPAAIPPALLINLDRSADRLTRMRAEFTRTGIAFEHFPAVNGTELPPAMRPCFSDGAGNIPPLRPDACGVPPPIAQLAASPSTIEDMGGREPLSWTRASPRTSHARRLAYNLKTMGLRQWLGCFVASRSARLRRHSSRPTNGG